MGKRYGATFDNPRVEIEAIRPAESIRRPPRFESARTGKASRSGRQVITGRTVILTEAGSDADDFAKILLRRARGQLGALADVAVDDRIGQIEFEAYNSTLAAADPFNPIARIEGRAQTVNSSATGGIVRFYTTDSSNVLTERGSINFAGQLRFGTITATTILGAGFIEANAQSSGNAVQRTLSLAHVTTIAPAAGIGVGVEFIMESTAGTRAFSAIDSVLTDVSATEDSDLIFSLTQASGAISEFMRLVGNTGGLHIGTSATDPPTGGLRSEGQIIGESTITATGGTFTSSGITVTGASRITGSLTLTGDLLMENAASTIVPGSTSFRVRNNANTANNLLVSDAGAVTVRDGFTVSAGGITVTGASTISGLTTVGALNSGSITSGFGNIDNGSSTLDTGLLTATGGTFTGSGITVTGASRITGTLNITGDFTMEAAASNIVPGSTSFAVRNNANTANNLLVSNAGAVTVRNGLTVSAGVVSVDDTTNSTSATTGSIHTDGGIGLTLDLFCGGRVLADEVEVSNGPGTFRFGGGSGVTRIQRVSAEVLNIVGESNGLADLNMASLDCTELVLSTFSTTAVSEGAADSGGTGFRLLRVPN